ncbi:MAG: UDP-2,4-diacetamido-2,4,6-trideoxy-beta-L-altropyranose hydrolase, partial [Pseudoalteromonas sp.]
MIIAFRTDASIQIGTGHVMRCLTLADELKKQGAECHFICREHQGHLNDLIQRHGHLVHHLPVAIKLQQQENTAQQLAHTDWLGSTQQTDAELCKVILKELKPHWLIVDHYALDLVWEKALKPHYNKLMVIDDLGDRKHIADLLLDQNYGSTVRKYQGLVPNTCKILVGTRFALLRPEFAQWREYSLKRRENTIEVKNILVTLGGADPDNYTLKVLAQLAKIQLTPQTKITVVMGTTAPHLESVKQQAIAMPVVTQVKVNVSNMAELMSNADLAIGAAGATTWERCCLGLPTIQLVIAENQRETALALSEIDAVKLIYNVEELTFLIFGTNK